MNNAKKETKTVKTKGVIGRILGDYGFVMVDGQNGDTFFHSDAAGGDFPSLLVGQKVEMEQVAAAKGWKAVNIKVVKENELVSWVKKTVFRIR